MVCYSICFFYTFYETKKGNGIFMKRRKIVGLFLLTATVVYLFASFLALYQNQRVKMEKGIEEALKVYSEKESQSVKELNKDVNLLLEEKADINDLKQEKLKNEGSFARIDKNVTNVTNQMNVMGKNISDVANQMIIIEKNITDVKDEIIIMENRINNLNDKVVQMEHYYKTFYEEMINMNSSLKDEVLQNKETIVVIKEEIKSVTDKILEIEKQLAENDLKQEDNIKNLQEQLLQYEERMTAMEEDVLYYRFDEETQTLNIYGKTKEQQESE